METIYKAITDLANEIGSEGDHNSREFARSLLEIFGETPIGEILKFWKKARKTIEKYNLEVFIPKS